MQELPSDMKVSKLKKIIRAIAVVLFFGFVLWGISRFGIPVRVSAKDVSIFEGICVDIPKGKKAYISYFPRLLSFRESFNYQDDANSPSVVVSIGEIGRDDWRKRLRHEPVRTELPVGDSIFQGDSSARVVGVSKGGSSCKLYIKYYGRYYDGMITGANVKDPADALALLGSGIFGRGGCLK